MITRATAGSCDGVTSASTSPEISSQTASPRAIAPSARPSVASACDRVRRPGAIHDQPSRRPAPAATKIKVSSSSPCGRISPKNTSLRPAAIMKPAIAPRLEMLAHNTTRTGRMAMPRIRQDAAARLLLSQICSAKSPAGFSL